MKVKSLDTAGWSTAVTFSSEAGDELVIFESKTGARQTLTQITFVTIKQFRHAQLHNTMHLPCTDTGNCACTH